MKKSLYPGAALLILVIFLAGCMNPLKNEPTFPPLATAAPGEDDGTQPGAAPGQPTADSTPGAPSIPTEGVVSSDDPFTPLPPAWEPQPEDKKMKRGEVFIDEFNFMVLESFPPQYVLKIKGFMPTPCHKLRIQVHPADEQGRIIVEAYSLIDPDPNLVCIQMLEAFQANVGLAVRESGHYTVWLNGQKIGEFDHP